MGVRHDPAVDNHASAPVYGEPLRPSRARVSRAGLPAAVWRFLGTASFIALPFLIFAWLCPFLSRRTIAMDYQTVAPVHQMELQFGLRMGTVPLVIPGFMGGQTASALTQGQLFHPISHLAAALPGYWNGRSLEWLTLLKLLELGVAHLVLFHFLGRLGLRTPVAFLIAFSVVYNLRMLDSFRYNVALESYAALLALCAALGFHFLEPSRRAPKLWIVVSTYLVVASGHPQWAFLGLVGASVYCVAAPFAIEAIRPGWRCAARLRQVGVAFAAMAIGGLLASAYAVPFYFDFMRNNSARVGRDYAWAAQLSQTPSALLASLLDPLHADVHGSFGGSALLLVAASVPVLLLFRSRVPAVVLALWGFGGLVVLAAAGSHTPVYRFLFEHMPLWSSFRIPGRVTLMLAPCGLLLLAWAAAPVDDEHGWANQRLLLLGMVALLILVLGHAAGTPLTAAGPAYSPHRIRQLPGWADAIVFGFALVSLVMLMASCVWRRRRSSLEVMLVLLVVGHVGALMYWGTWQSRKLPMPTFAAMLEQRRASRWLLDWPEDVALPWGGLGAAPLQEYLEVADRDPRLAWTTQRCIRVEGLREAYKLVRDRHWPEELVLEGAMKCPNTTGEAVPPGLDRVSLADISFNRMTFEVESQDPGFLAVNVPYTTHARTYWKAEVNGKKAATVRANGIAHAVAIPGGRSRVELRYWSWPAFIGLLMSAATGAAVLAYAAGALPWRSGTVMGRIGAVAIMVALIYGWSQQLYTGQSWGTYYVWTSIEPHPHR